MGLNDKLAPSALDGERIDLAGVPERRAPVGPRTRRRKFQAVYSPEVLEQIQRHGQEATEVEICGVLIGNVYRDAGGPWLHVESSIRGDSAEGRETQVTFKAETWEYIQREMEEKYPDKRIVGWYHTHPGFGIFLSGMDLFIQEHFFNLPWQVAFVYDPIGGDAGSFVWRRGKSQRERFLVEVDADGSRFSSAPLSDGYIGGGAAGDGGAVTLAEPRGSRWVMVAVALILSFVLAGIWFTLFHSP